MIFRPFSEVNRTAAGTRGATRQKQVNAFIYVLAESLEIIARG